MNPRAPIAIGGVVAAALLIAGLLLLVLPVHATGGGVTVACGNVFNADSGTARRNADDITGGTAVGQTFDQNLRNGMAADMAAVACSRSVHERAVWGWVVVGLGVLAGGATAIGGAASTRNQRRAAAAAAARWQQWQQPGPGGYPPGPGW